MSYRKRHIINWLLFTFHPSYRRKLRQRRNWLNSHL